jgi:polar amino acid transport system substrate-binding protein
MRRMTLASGLLVALLLVSCGSSSTSPPSAKTVGPYQGPWPSKVASINSEIPAAILALAPLQLATAASSPPSDGIDPNTGAIIGWDVDLAHALCSAMGVVCTENNMTFDDILAQLKASTPDEIKNGDKPAYVFSISGWTPTQKREDSGIDFIEYYQSGENWISRVGGPPLSSAVDMCGHKVAVGSGGIEETQTWGFLGKQVGGVQIPGDKNNCQAAGKPDITILSFATFPETIAALVSGRVDYTFTDGNVLYTVTQVNGTGPKKIQIAGPTCGVAAYAIALVKGNPIEKPLMDALKYIIDNGYYGKILSNWNSQDGAITSSQVTLNNNSASGPVCVPPF